MDPCAWTAQASPRPARAVEPVFRPCRVPLIHVPCPRGQGIQPALSNPPVSKNHLCDRVGQRQITRGAGKTAIQEELESAKTPGVAPSLSRQKGPCCTDQPGWGLGPGSVEVGPALQDGDFAVAGPVEPSEASRAAERAEQSQMGGYPVDNLLGCSLCHSRPMP